MASPLLELRGVHTHIGQYHILHGVDLAVPEGQVTLLLGRNGAGKTTTLRTVLGLWRASSGTIAFEGEDIARLPTPDIARLGIGYVPEDMGIFPALSVREHLLLAVRKGRPAPERLAWVFALFPALEKLWTLRAGLLSGGQKQMLAIARAIIEPRRLLVIDEPSKGLSPAVVEQIAQALNQLKAQHTTILMVEQNFELASRVGDTAAVMADGRVVYRGRMSDLADPALRTRLLGLHLEAAS